MREDGGVGGDCGDGGTVGGEEGGESGSGGNLGLDMPPVGRWLEYRPGGRGERKVGDKHTPVVRALVEQTRGSHQSGLWASV